MLLFTDTPTDTMMISYIINTVQLKLYFNTVSVPYADHTAANRSNELTHVFPLSNT